MKKKTIQSFLKPNCGKYSNLLNFLPSFLKKSMFLARGVFFHKVLCSQVCSFNACVFP